MPGRVLLCFSWVYSHFRVILFPESRWWAAPNPGSPSDSPKILIIRLRIILDMGTLNQGIL